jgi:hypothetical protein
VDRGGYNEGQQVPKARAEVVSASVEKAVADGDLWLVSGPTSLFAARGCCRSCLAQRGVCGFVGWLLVIQRLAASLRHSPPLFAGTGPAGRVFVHDGVQSFIRQMQ